MARTWEDLENIVLSINEVKECTCLSPPPKTPTGKLNIKWSDVNMKAKKSRKTVKSKKFTSREIISVNGNAKAESIVFVSVNLKDLGVKNKFKTFTVSFKMYLDLENALVKTISFLGTIPFHLNIDQRTGEFISAHVPMALKAKTKNSFSLSDAAEKIVDLVKYIVFTWYNPEQPSINEEKDGRKDIQPAMADFFNVLNTQKYRMTQRVYVNNSKKFNKHRSKIFNGSQSGEWKKKYEDLYTWVLKEFGNKFIAREDFFMSNSSSKKKEEMYVTFFDAYQSPGAKKKTPTSTQKLKVNTRKMKEKDIEPDKYLEVFRKFNLPAFSSVMTPKSLPKEDRVFHHREKKRPITELDLNVNVKANTAKVIKPGIIKKSDPINIRRSTNSKDDMSYMLNLNNNLHVNTSTRLSTSAPDGDWESTPDMDWWGGVIPYDGREIIGSGAQSTVLKVGYKGDEYALKELNSKSVENRDSVFRELRNMLLSIDSPYIIRLHDVYLIKKKQKILDSGEITPVVFSPRTGDCQTVSFLLEYMSCGSLVNMVKITGEFEEKVLRACAWMMFQALVYLKEKNIVHRDIKPDNVLVNHNGCCKLSDFGHSRTLTTDSKGSTMCGTAIYMSPERIGMWKHQYKSDVWSATLTLLFCAKGDYLGFPVSLFKYVELKKELQFLIENERSTEVDKKKLTDLLSPDYVELLYPENGPCKFSPEFVEFIEKGLAFTQQKRPDASEMLETLPFFTNGPKLTKESAEKIIREFIEKEFIEKKRLAKEKKERAKLPESFQRLINQGPPNFRKKRTLGNLNSERDRKIESQYHKSESSPSLSTLKKSRIFDRIRPGEANDELCKALRKGIKPQDLFAQIEEMKTQNSDSDSDSDSDADTNTTKDTRGNDPIDFGTFGDSDDEDIDFGN